MMTLLDKYSLWNVPKGGVGGGGGGGCGNEERDTSGDVSTNTTPPSDPDLKTLPDMLKPQKNLIPVVSLQQLALFKARPTQLN